MSDFVAQVAARRSALHEGQSSSRPLSEGYEDVGLRGEVAFGEFCGLCPDFSDRPAGDAGFDFVVPLLYRVDVKTARNAKHLLHPADKPMNADIYVLAEYVGGKATLVGWAWRKTLEDAPVADIGGCGIQSYYVPRESLKPMGALEQRIWRAG